MAVGKMKKQDKKENNIIEAPSSDGVDRRGFLKCMAWAGTGVVWTFAGGVPVSRLFGANSKPGDQSSFSFVQISDSHIGFNKPANTDVVGTLKKAIARINPAAMAVR